MGVERARLKNMAVTTQTPFCAVTLGALDERPVAESGKLLLTAAARMANTGMEWDAAHTTLTKWGEAPTRIEPVKATVTLTGLAGARQVTATPLTGAGAATPEKIDPRPLRPHPPLRNNGAGGGREEGVWEFWRAGGGAGVE